MAKRECDVLVVGSGPGGYTAGIRAGQLGLDTIVVEAEKPGGTCLNVGCIPSKGLLHIADRYASVIRAHNDSELGIHAEHPTLNLEESMVWKDAVVRRLGTGVSGLLKKAGVKTVNGWARMVDSNTAIVESGQSESVEIRARHVVLATGSCPIEIDRIPFGGRVISSADALSLTKVPSKLVVVGGGYIGLEIGTAYAKCGSSVIVVEARESLLPAFDTDLVRPVASSLKQLGVTVLTNTTVRGLSADGSCLTVRAGDGNETELSADHFLVAVGRSPLIEGWGLDSLGLARVGNYVKIDEECRTSADGVFAVGDLTGEPMLAHRAMAQGEMVAEIIAGQRRRWDPAAMPAVVFTDPEIVVVGLSPDDARGQNIPVVEGSFPLAANGRAISTDDDTGFVRVVPRADDHVVIGVQAVGGGISELSAAFSLAIEMGSRVEDLTGMIHAHPTRSEAFGEAAGRILGSAIHI